MAQAVVFLSHSGVDAEAARELKRRLEESISGREAGLRVWLDVEGGLVPGAVGWQKQIATAIDQTCTAFTVHVGSRGVVNWVENEVELGLSRATRDKIPFIPILAKETPSAALPPFARRYQAVRDPLNDAGEFAKLLAAVLQTGKPPIGVDEPFVGLRAMTEDDALLFFGRDKELEELEGKLAKSRLVAVVADSGSGKSSLVRAGLIRHYRGGVFVDRRSREPDGRIWHVVAMRPGASPIDGLRIAVTAAAEQRGLSIADKNDLRNAIDFDNPRQTAYALQCNLPAAATETLLVVDQFEELFTQTPQPQRQPFIDWLLSLVAPGGQPSFRIVLTMRSDHFNLCSAHKALFDLVSRDDAVLRLKAISPEGLADIVREPLRLAGRTDQGEQEALIRQIRQQASDRAGDLALVQMALHEAWTRRRQHNDNLVESFVAVGGVAGALANAAEEVRTERLDETEQQLLEAVLVRLVSMGEAAGATRRTAKLEEFGSRGSPKRLLIDKLADDKHGRLLLTGLETVEICHEQLVTQWGRWQTWIYDHALDMRRLARLMVKASEWSAAPMEERPTYLATGADLQIFSSLAAAHPDWLSETERMFVADSRQQDEDRIRREEEARETERKLRKEAEENAKQAEANATVAQANADKAQTKAIQAKRWFRGAMALSALLAIAVLGVLGSMLNAQTQTKRAMENETRALVALSGTALTQGRANDAAKLAIAAWPRGAKDSARPQLESTLNALSAALSKSSLYQREFRHDGPVTGALLMPDGTRALSFSDDSTLRLWDLASGQQIGPAMQHKGPVEGAVLTPDGSRALSWSGDHTLRLWDLASGQQIGHAMRQDDAVYGALLMPHGSRALSWTFDTLRMWDLTSGQQIGPAMRHDDRVNGVLLSLDGSHVLSWSADNTLRLWDLASGKQLGAVMRHDQSVTGALLTSDGAGALSWSDDNSLRLWELSSGKQLGPALQHHGNVTGAVMIPNGNRVLSWTVDMLRLWNLSSAQQIGPGVRLDAGVIGALLMPDGTRALSWSDDKSLRLCDLTSGKQLGPAMQHNGWVTGALLTSDGNRALSWSDDDTLRLWDLTSGKQLGPAMQHNGSVRGALLTSDGNHALSWSDDNTLRLWDLAGGKQLGLAMQHNSNVTGALLMPDGNRALSWSDDNTLRLWDLAGGKQLGLAMQHNRNVTGALLMPDGNRALSWSDDNTLRLWDLASGKQIGPTMQHNGPVEGALLMPDGSRALSWSDDETLRLWDLASGEQSGLTMQNNRPVEGALLTPDGSRALSWSDDSILRLWDLASGKQISPTMQHDASVKGALLTPDGSRALSWSDDSTLRLWDLASGKQISPTMHHDGPVEGALLAPDGSRALSWSDDETLRLWDLPSGQQMGPAMQHDASVNGALLMPDGGRVLSWSDDETLRLWDLPSGQQMGPAMQHDASVNGALLAPDGGRALSWSDDETLRLWDLPSGQQMGPAMQHGASINGALLMPDGGRALSWSDDNGLRLWNIGWPKSASMIEVGCRLVRTDDLSSFASRYGIELRDPICLEGVPIPSPDWTRIKPAK
ncbi:TIR domain-containing protein [Rhizobium laguerreae]|uniref:nSTAND1 domain-containing NTPase n=1 Tax=Rhizobium laguerreae TaxID=1076926 RepID=UPI001C920C19|nr:TIR domain-containing protein [Rhizobium laguerreae]MBY3335288.1 TIR domain-containing protein [Rhizobium laguerreae]